MSAYLCPICSPVPIDCVCVSELAARVCSSFANRPFIMPTKQSMTAAFSTHILEGREEREQRKATNKGEPASTPTLQPCSSR